MTTAINLLILLASLAVLGLNLKLYTEILKDRSQDRRQALTKAPQTGANQMSATEQKLKPCPFCGSDDLTDQDDYIVCKACNAYGPTADINETIEDAWNRRAPNLSNP